MIFTIAIILMSSIIGISDVQAQTKCKGSESVLTVTPDSSGVFYGYPLPAPGVDSFFFGWYPSDLQPMNITAISIDAVLPAGEDVEVTLDNWTTGELWYGLVLPVRFKTPITVNEFGFLMMPASGQFEDWTFNSFTVCYVNKLKAKR
jgi:hypothetical protein